MHFCHILVAVLFLSAFIHRLTHFDPSTSCLCTLNIRSIFHHRHSAALSDIIASYHPDLFALTETWVKPTTTPTKLAHCTPPNYTFFIFPGTSNPRSSTAAGGGTGFLIREPFTQLPTSLPEFFSLEFHNSITLKLPQSKA